MSALPERTVLRGLPLHPVRQPGQVQRLEQVVRRGLRLGLAGVVHPEPDPDHQRADQARRDLLPGDERLAAPLSTRSRRGCSATWSSASTTTSTGSTGGGAVGATSILALEPLAVRLGRPVAAGLLAAAIGLVVLPRQLVNNTTLVLEGSADDVLQLLLGTVVPTVVMVVVAVRRGSCSLDRALPSTHDSHR